MDICYEYVFQKLYETENLICNIISHNSSYYLEMSCVRERTIFPYQLHYNEHLSDL